MPEPASASAESALREPPAYRLVIRAQIVADPIPEPPQARSKPRTLVAVGAAVVLLIVGWTGFLLLRTAPVTDQSARVAPRITPPPVTPVVQSPPPAAPDAPLRPVERFTPLASPNALKTIRGTIRVAIEVTIDRQGRVIDAVAAERGPSRYFERVSLDASRRWTFTPASTDAPRHMRLQFHFTREGATAIVPAA